MPTLIFALSWNDQSTSIVLGIVLVLVLLVPFLIKEIRDGKREFGPLRIIKPGGGVALGPITPSGTGDYNPGRVGDPAPGEPSGQPNPWGERAQRHAPPIKS